MPRILVRDKARYVPDASEATYASSLWGPTCDGLDCLTREAQLPQLKIGDWLVYDAMGAYTVAAGSEFNGFPRPRRLYINTEHASVKDVYGYNMTPSEVFWA